MASSKAAVLRNFYRHSAGVLPAGNTVDNRYDGLRTQSGDTTLSGGTKADTTLHVSSMAIMPQLCLSYHALKPFISSAYMLPQCLALFIHEITGKGSGRGQPFGKAID